MTEVSTNKPPRSFTIIAIVAIVWNAFGVMAYIMQVTMSEEALAALPADQQALYAALPAWVTGAYAVAVFAGLLGSIGLAMKKKWSVPVLTLSLLGIVLQMTYSLFISDLISVMGMGAVIMPVVIVLIGAFLVVYSRGAAAKGWLS